MRVAVELVDSGDATRAVRSVDGPLASRAAGEAPRAVGEGRHRRFGSHERAVAGDADRVELVARPVDRSQDVRCRSAGDVVFGRLTTEQDDQPHPFRGRRLGIARRSTCWRSIVRLEIVRLAVIHGARVIAAHAGRRSISGKVSVAELRARRAAPKPSGGVGVWVCGFVLRGEFGVAELDARRAAPKPSGGVGVWVCGFVLRGEFGVAELDARRAAPKPVEEESCCFERTS